MITHAYVELSEPICTCKTASLHWWLDCGAKMLHVGCKACGASTSRSIFDFPWHLRIEGRLDGRLPASQALGPEPDPGQVPCSKLELD